MTKAGGKPYAAIYADAPWHPKMRAIPEHKRLAAFGFWTAAIALCQAYRTDGEIPREQLPGVFACTEQQREHLVGLLLEVGLFDEIEGGIAVHDFLEWNRSAEEIELARRGMSEGGRRGGKASGESRRRGGSKPPLQGPTEKSKSEQRSDEHEPSERVEGLCPDCGQTLTAGECWACSPRVRQ